MLDAIAMAEAKISPDIRTYCIRVEHDRIKEGREYACEGGLARAGQAHN